MNHYVWVLGAPDPEMERIAKLLSHERVLLACVDGWWVHAGNAYRATKPRDRPGMIWVESLPADVGAATAIRQEKRIVDHHRFGDPGFGRSPAEYWEASSLGQVATRLGVQPSEALRVIAAADHCLTAAYAGKCPGVLPHRLSVWRAESRARHQRRPTEAVMRDVTAAKAKLRSAPLVGVLRDMRGPVTPELPEAAAQLGIAYVAGPLPTPDGRRKIVVGGCTSYEWVEAWLRGEGVAADLVDRYGDPARGFAGGYLPEDKESKR